MIRILVAIVALAPWLSVSASVEDDIAERIKKVGSVCIQGEDCASAAAVGGGAVAAGGGVSDNYKKTCATCHDLGVAGAPKFGDAGQWQARIAKGMDVLYNSGINGMPPAMPAKGMCFQCSDDDIKALVDYMVDAAQ